MGLKSKAVHIGNNNNNKIKKKKKKKNKKKKKKKKKKLNICANFLANYYMIILIFKPILKEIKFIVHIIINELIYNYLIYK